MRGDDTMKRQLEQRAMEERRQGSGSTTNEDLLDRALEEGADRDEEPAPREGRQTPERK